ncbi:hypothetical protein PS2_034696 [Malus domestica]
MVALTVASAALTTSSLARSRARSDLFMAEFVLGHHGGRLKRTVGDLSHRELLVVRLLSGDHRSIRGKHKMDPGVWNQVTRELGHIHIQSSVEPQRRCQRRNDMRDEAIQIGVDGTLDVEGPAADVCRWPHCRATQTRRCAPAENGWREHCCKSPQQM